MVNKQANTRGILKIYQSNVAEKVCVYRQLNWGYCTLAIHCLFEEESAAP